MPVTLETRENGHVQLYILLDPWKVEELTSLYPIDKTHRDSVSFKVHTLVDVSQIAQVPPGVLSVRYGLPPLDHPRSGQIVVVGAINFVKVMSELVLRIAHHATAEYFNSRDEGWAYLRQWMIDNPD